MAATCSCEKCKFSDQAVLKANESRSEQKPYCTYPGKLDLNREGDCQSGMTTKPEPRIIGADCRGISYSDARIMWENGKFGYWAAQHGFPLLIDGVPYPNWTGVEDALSDDQWDK